MPMPLIRLTDLPRPKPATFELTMSEKRDLCRLTSAMYALTRRAAREAGPDRALAAVLAALDQWTSGWRYRRRASFRALVRAGIKDAIQAGALLHLSHAVTPGAEEEAA